LASKHHILNSLKHFGAEHYVKARERGDVLYVEGGTDVDMLRALAEKLGHQVAEVWDERINTFHVQNNYPRQDVDAELERVEGGFGLTPREHFNGLRNLLPALRGLAILNNDGQNRQDRDEGALRIRSWRRDETENHVITPEVLRRYALSQHPTEDLFAVQGEQFVHETLQQTLVEQVFDGVVEDWQAWSESPAEAARLVWEAKTQRLKLSELAEVFFRRLASRQNAPVMLKKGEFHRLVPFASLGVAADAEVRAKLDMLADLFVRARPHGEQVVEPATNIDDDVDNPPP